jgi:hypothetical protein
VGPNQSIERGQFKLSNSQGGRCRLKGTVGARIWQSWAALAYDIDAVTQIPEKNDSS